MSLDRNALLARVDDAEALGLLARMVQFKSYSGTPGETEVEKYLKKSGLLEKKPGQIRLDVMQETAEEGRLIEGIRHLISE